MSIDDLARCDREIAEAHASQVIEPAYRPTMWLNDWTVERDLILKEMSYNTRHGDKETS